MLKPYDATTPLHFSEQEIAEAKALIASSEDVPLYVDDLRRLALRAILSIERLREAIWPGLPRWEPTAEQPQQDFFEAICESFRPTLRPRSEWHEELSSVLWWHIPIREEPMVGWDEEAFDAKTKEGAWTPLHAALASGWVTHWTPLPMPSTDGAELLVTAPPQAAGEEESI